MKKFRCIIVLAVCCFCSFTSFAQQHNQGFFGISINGGLALNNDIGKMIGIKYFRFLNGDFTLGGQILFTEDYKKLPEIGRHAFHRYFALLAGEYTFLKSSPFFISLGINLGVGYENMKGLDMKLKENFLEISKGGKNSFGILAMPKIEGEYYLFGTFALLAEVAVMYFPFSNGEYIAPMIGIGIKQIF